METSLAQQLQRLGLSYQNKPESLKEWQNFIDLINQSYKKLQDALHDLAFKTQILQHVESVTQVGTMSRRDNTIEWSDELYSIFGIDKSVPPSRAAFLGALHPDDRDRINRCFEELVAKRAKFEEEIRVLTPTGLEKHCTMMCELDTKLVPGAHIIFRGIVLDISQRKQAEADRIERDIAEKLSIEMLDLNKALDKEVQERTHELNQTQALLMNAAKMAALGEMAGGVAHEINNPLMAIQLLVEQIKGLIRSDPTKWQDKVLRQADVILRSVKHIASIVDGLRTFSHGGSNDKFEKYPLRVLIENTLKLCQAKLNHNEIRLEVAEINESTHVYCRPTQITQILLNLIANASDAVTELPERWIKISVKEKEKDKLVEIRVTDSGKGIPEHLRDKIFEPLFTTKEIGKGTGLGLSISKGIIAAHQGSLELNTESPHTEFIIRLLTEAPQKENA